MKDSKEAIKTIDEAIKLINELQKTCEDIAGIKEIPRGDTTKYAKWSKRIVCKSYHDLDDVPPGATFLKMTTQQTWGYQWKTPLDGTNAYKDKGHVLEEHCYFWFMLPGDEE